MHASGLHPFATGSRRMWSMLLPPQPEISLSLTTIQLNAPLLGVVKARELPSEYPPPSREKYSRPDVSEPLFLIKNFA